MASSAGNPAVRTGDGWAAAHIDAIDLDAAHSFHDA